MRRVLWILAVAASLVGFGLLAIWFKQDANWDLANYHLYNAFAFLNGRLDFDIAPAQVQTFINPLLDLPFYLLVTHFSARVTVFWLGVLHGLNFWLLFLAAREFTRQHYQKTVATLWALLIAVAGFIAPVTLAEHGKTFNDNFVSVFFLLGLWLLLRSAYSTKPRMAAALFLSAGVLVGAGAGLKLTGAALAIGTTAAVVVIKSGSLKKRAVYFGTWLVATGAGFLLANGHWMYVLWTRYHNPVFPFANQFFKSPVYFTAKVLYAPKPADSVWDILLFPFALLQKGIHAMQWPFQDARHALVVTLLLLSLAAIAYLLLKKQRARVAAHRVSIALLVLYSVSFLVWGFVYYDYRYAQTLELLAPLVAFAALVFLIPRTRPKLGTVLQSLALVLCIGWMNIPDFGSVEFSQDFFDVRPRLTDTKPATVLLPGSGPRSYLIPFFPEQYRFVRIDGSLVAWNGERYDNAGFVDRFIRPTLAETHDPLFALFQKQDDLRIERVLAEFNLRLLDQNCQKFSAHITRAKYSLCRVERL